MIEQPNALPKMGLNLGTLKFHSDSNLIGDSDITSDTKTRTQSISPKIKSLLSKKKIIKFDNNSINSILANRSIIIDPSSAEVSDMSEIEIDISRILFVDLRKKKKFELFHIPDSLNPVIPTLVFKRLKKGIFTNFDLVNFLTETEQSEYMAWKSEEGRKLIIIYDDDMDEEGDAVALVGAACGDAIHSLTELTVAVLPKGIACLQSNLCLDDLTSPTNRTSAALRKKAALQIDILEQEENSLRETKTASPSSANDCAQLTEAYSAITTNLLLGSNALPGSSTGPQQLASLGVTHILNMALEIPPTEILKSSSNFIIKWIPVIDNSDVDMDDALKESIQFIDEAIKSNPQAKVFVHCKAGKSRSVSVVIGYLVSHKNHTLKSAYQLVRQNRKGVSPNLGFMAALLKMERKLHGENSEVSNFLS